jgi:hypothetical protein
MSLSLEQSRDHFERGHNDGSFPLLLPSEAEDQRNRIEKTQLWHARQLQLEQEERCYAGNRKDWGVVDAAAAAAGLAYDGEQIHLTSDSGWIESDSLTSYSPCSWIILESALKSTIYGVTMLRNLFLFHDVLFRL